LAHSKHAAHVHFAVVVGEERDVLGRESEAPRLRIVGQITRGSLIRQPLAHVPLVRLRSLRKFF
jgi:hypothetical protein